MECAGGALQGEQGRGRQEVHAPLGHRMGALSVTPPSLPTTHAPSHPLVPPLTPRRRRVCAGVMQRWKRVRKVLRSKAAAVHAHFSRYQRHPRTSCHSWRRFMEGIRVCACMCVCACVPRYVVTRWAWKAWTVGQERSRRYPPSPSFPHPPPSPSDPLFLSSSISCGNEYMFVCMYVCACSMCCV